MKTGQALRLARESKGMKQSDLGNAVFLSDKTISAYENDARRLPKELTPTIVAKLDDARLALEVAGEVTGGMAPPLLDGPKADLHRMTTIGFMISEMREALSKIEGAEVFLRARSGDELDEAGRRHIHDTLRELAEALTSIANGIPVICLTYGESPGQIYQELRAELALKGFITYEEARRTA